MTELRWKPNLVCRRAWPLADLSRHKCLKKKSEPWQGGLQDPDNFRLARKNECASPRKSRAISRCKSSTFAADGRKNLIYVTNSEQEFAKCRNIGTPHAEDRPRWSWLCYGFRTTTPTLMGGATLEGVLDRDKLLAILGLNANAVRSRVRCRRLRQSAAPYQLGLLL